MSIISSNPTRLPAALWESLQEICWRQDNKFLEDVARITGISASEIKKKVLGVRGAVCSVVSETGPWWVGTSCPIMIPGAGEMWRRCTSVCEINGYCHDHRTGKGMRYDHPYFEDLPKRMPFRFEDEIVWVSEEDGSVLTGGGTVLKNITIDIRNGLATDHTHYCKTDKSESVAKTSMSITAGAEPTPHASRATTSPTSS